MFQLFPALILLLLQGSSNFERYAVDSRLPGSLEAIHRQSVQIGTPKLTERQEHVLASLIASGSKISTALLSFLWGVGEEQPQPVDAKPLTSDRIVDRTVSIRREGYSRNRRVRDGPLAIDVA